VFCAKGTSIRGGDGFDPTWASKDETVIDSKEREMYAKRMYCEV